MLLLDFVNKYLKKKSEGILGKIDRKLAIKGVGALGESVKKGKFGTKMFFR